jgi:hypothetical protein
MKKKIISASGKISLNSPKYTVKDNSEVQATDKSSGWSTTSIIAGGALIIGVANMFIIRRMRNSSGDTFPLAQCRLGKCVNEISPKNTI